jgi:curved DNA binding protein
MESTKRDHHDSGDEEYKDESFIDKPAVLDKYKAAAAIANEALNKVTKLCVVGADIHAVC